MIFIPAPIANMAYAQRKSAVSWNTDLTDDSLFFMVGKLVADVHNLLEVYTPCCCIDKQEFFMEDNFLKIE
jgi:hypothetical protein